MQMSPFEKNKFTIQFVLYSLNGKLHDFGNYVHGK